MYQPVDPKTDFPKMEEAILAFWKERDIFRKSILNREGSEEFVFYDGPPFATGLPHFGHFVQSTIKDVIPRYKTMRGVKAERRFGWDCHGLPVEYEMEKELKISGKRQIEDYGVARFNEACRSIVLRYTKEWRTVITRLGRWVDFDHDYKTMDPDYMESIWWVVSELWKRDLVYEGFYILPYCPRCSTALSNFELNLGGYTDVQDPAVTVRFALDGEPRTYILAWTTTPWTLPSNLALALGPDIDYVKVKDGEDQYIIARERLSAYYQSEADYKVVKTYKGKELAGIAYEPLFPYFKDLKEKGAFRAVTGDFVTTEDGTGVVHIAPGFGEDDYNALKSSGLPVICPVDAEGRFLPEVADYRGQFVKDADKAIIKDLKEQGKLVKRDSYTHPYPHCWRCSSPLIYRAIASWFVSVTKIKDKMLAANEKINWVPGHLRHGRFGKWLEGARDWAISRNRYWGNPIPIWRCETCGKTECLGSRDELEKRSGKKAADLHKHFIDEITLPCACGGVMRRVSEVLDCWFESGSMPYGQNHYPFEHKEFTEAHFPADFITEALEQTRGWFYTLTVLAAALFDKPAFKNVIAHGLVLDVHGKKMSKSLRNYTDPTELMAAYGADALRLCLMYSAVMKAEDLRFSDDGVKEILKTIIIPLWNAYSFFVTYANIDQAHPDQAPAAPANPLDRWIISRAERMVEEVTAMLESYDIPRAVAPLVDFIDLLNNWYIRRSRRRFWRSSRNEPRKGEFPAASSHDTDKAEAYQTLYAVLMKLVYVAAPFIPFITEKIYQNLKSPGLPESVHLCDYPAADSSRRDPALEKKMETVRRAVSMGHALRSLHNLKNRQPLASLHLVTRDQSERAVLEEMEEIIREELNVKSVVFRENEEELVEYRLKANFKVLGKTLGKDMKEAAALIEKFGAREASALLGGRTVPLAVSGRTIQLDKESIVILRLEKEGLKVANEGSLTVAVDPTLTPALIQEGLVRDLVRGIQNLRKEKELNVVDRIRVSLHGSEAVREAVRSFETLLKEETLAVEWQWEKAKSPAAVDCGEEVCLCAIEKAV